MPTLTKRKTAALISTVLSSLTLPLGIGLAAATLGTTGAAAQDLTSGSIIGQVKDGAGNPIVGAVVELKSVARGTSVTSTTDAAGNYRFGSNQVGTYSVSIKAADFVSPEASQVTVSVGRVEALDFTLKSTAEVVETVVVYGARRRAVDFSATTTGINVNVQETFDRLPIARNVAAIQLLAPGAVAGDSAFGNGAFSSLISLGGASVAENIYYINGMNVTNFRTFEGGSTIPFEFYDQIQVKTGGYQAEYGRATGGAVVAVTKAGSNDFHGGLNYYVEPQGLRSQAPNTYTQLNEKDKRVREEGNVWLSGPIWKDRAFFYGFYNARNLENTDTSASLTSPTNPTRGPENVFKSVSDDPFYGGKIDVNLFDGHRLEFTYINDSSVETDETNTVTELGGVTRVAKYTGKIKDWMSVSMLWGDNKFARTSAGPLDSQAGVFARLTAGGLVDPTNQTGGTIQRGNPNLTVEKGDDSRELFRADLDFFFNLVGDHHLRVGYDSETLEAISTTFYSGGIYYRYYRSGTAGALSGRIAPNTNYVRVRKFDSGGTFGSTNQAIYIQDDWKVNDRLTLNLGLRSEDFTNNNAAGAAFTKLTQLIAPRIGVSYDVFGDRSTKLSGFFGRYYLPVAANTNIRLAGNEKFTQDWYLYSAVDPTTLVPTLAGAAVLKEVLSDSSNANPATLISKNLEPQYQDEFCFGVEHVFENKWRVGATFAYRDLKSVLEDFDASYVQANFCASSARPSSISVADCNDMTIGSGGYVLINPGKEVVVDVDAQGTGALTQITIPTNIVDLPEAQREYTSIELRFERPWDGKWQLQGSYVWSKSYGNYEGGVKSDNGQNDTGLTQDFDEPGWMDGSKGRLPNDRTHAFKLFGSYALMDNLIAGANLRATSGRSYGCIGPYPKSDGRASPTGLSAWYCNATGVAGNSKLTPRGSQFEGDWTTNLDVSLAYKLDFLKLGETTLRLDVFNLLDSQEAVDFNEFGNDSGGTPDPFYRAPTSYQAPRAVRIGFSYEF